MRCGAFGLLYRGGLEKVSELAVNPSPLRGRRLGHRCCCDVLASAIKDWGLLTSFVVVDAVVYVMGPLSGPSAVTAALLLLLESVSELL